MPTPHVEAVKLDELNGWRIRHGQAELLVTQQGAHILSYQVDGQHTGTPARMLLPALNVAWSLSQISGGWPST